MTPFIQQSLSRAVLKALVKPGPGAGGMGIDYNRALDNVAALYRNAVGNNANDVLIPLPEAQKPRVRQEGLTDVDIEAAITPLFDYFDSNLATLNTNLSDEAKEMVLTRLWKEILNVIEALLIPPLSEAQSELTPLTDKEVDIVFKWLRVIYCLAR